MLAARMPRPRLILYYDLHSPFSYLALYLIKNSAVFKSCEVTYVPILLVALIQPLGIVPPWSSQNKVNYMFRDIERWAHELNIPWKAGLPENYPFKATTLNAQRVLTACSIECPDRHADLAAALFHAFWVEKKGVQAPAVYAPIAKDVLGRDLATKVLTQASTTEVKNLLRKNMSDALESGAVGLPWMRAINSQGQEDVFWGVDHLAAVAKFLELGRLPGYPHL